MTYFNKNYYPTPIEVIRKMTAGIDFKKKAVLDPSAGMGAILDQIKYTSGIKCYAIEIDPNFQAALKGKGYTVLHGDFLQYSGVHAFDYILMNPPFDAGEKHLRKAWDIAKPGCKIVCLLNEETVMNLHTQGRRQLFDIVQNHGTTERLGDCFSKADRKTGVDVVMITLMKPQRETVTNFEGVKSSDQIEAPDLSSTSGAVEQSDKMDAYCRAYAKALESLEAVYRSVLEFNLFASAFTSEYGVKEILLPFTEGITSQIRSRSYTELHNEAAFTLQGKAWEKMFNDSRITALMTGKVKEDFEKKRAEMGGFDLNVENIMAAFGAIIANRSDISKACIREAFERMTYYSEKNREYFGESWKTNSHYMVGKKVILNCHRGWGYFDRRETDKINDIERALCHISGDKYDDIVSVGSVLNEASNNKRLFDFEHESHFFKFRYYQKGSLHLTFKNDDIRMRFNKIACEGMGWQLPEQEKFSGKAKRK
jgi:predicted RNA methylase